MSQAWTVLVLLLDLALAIDSNTEITCLRKREALIFKKTNRERKAFETKKKNG